MKQCGDQILPGHISIKTQPSLYSLMRKDTTSLGNQRRSPPIHAPVVASIVQIYGGDLGRRYRLTEEITIGRDESNAVIVDLTTVSRRHARLFEKDGLWHVVDMESTNGTYVNGEETQDETRLSNGDLLKLGGAVFKFIEGGNIEALYHEEIYRLTILDGLTGVHNKRYFLEFLEREMTRSTRHGRPLSLAMVDIDHFKQVNDTYGHVTGDHILQSLARLISADMRRDELLARYGGEEFVFVLPETDSTQAELFCERIRRLVEKQVFEFDEKEIRVTISLGVVSMRQAFGLDDFIGAADEHLYMAKQAGRNQVIGDSAAPSSRSHTTTKTE